jgi:glycosyltransferase EpsJ
MKKISVIIAVYNVGQYLEKCIASVVAQSYTHLEIIVVNDGSTDNSPSVISRYAQQDSRIVGINKSNGGLSDARNAGMQAATGDYLCFLDGDDWYDDHFVETLYNRMVSGNFDLVCCNYRYVWDSGKTKEKNFLNGLPSLLDNREAISAFLTQRIIGSVAIKIFKRSICEDNHLRFRKDLLWEDLIFTLNYLFYAQKTGIIHQTLYNYYQERESISRNTDQLIILHNIQSASLCVKMNEERNPGLFVAENRNIITKAFIGILVYSFKCNNAQIWSVLLQELQKYKPGISIRLLPFMEKVLIILYRINYSLARLLFLNIYKKLQ